MAQSVPWDPVKTSGSTQNSPLVPAHASLSAHCDINVVYTYIVCVPFLGCVSVDRASFASHFQFNLAQWCCIGPAAFWKETNACEVSRQPDDDGPVKPHEWNLLSIHHSAQCCPPSSSGSFGVFLLFFHFISVCACREGRG